MKQMTIPRIIHQTWKTKDIPDAWQEYVASWKHHHPDWEYRFWTDEDNRNFIAERFPDFLPVFDAFSFNINRVDAVRYCLLYEFGGLYVDMDFECLRPINDLVATGGFAVAQEPSEHEEAGVARLSNAFMASPPGHPFLAAVLQRLQHCNPRGQWHIDVLEKTGPIMLAEAALAYQGDDISYLEPRTIFPLAFGPELAQLTRNDDDAAMIRSRLVGNGAYAVHLWENSWVRNLAGELVNPRPHAVSGYDFYPGHDSGGYDLDNVGRNIPECARLCDGNNQAVGFNTDGYLKCYIKPRPQWGIMVGAGEGEGLYVKKDRLRQRWANLRYRYIPTALVLSRRTLSKE